MAEYLDNLLAVDHFFNIAIHVTQIILLLLNKVDTALCRQWISTTFRYEKNEKQRQTMSAIHCRYSIETNTATIVTQEDQQLRQALRNHLTQGIGIVGIMTHNIAMCMRIKIFDRQLSAYVQTSHHGSSLRIPWEMMAIVAVYRSDWPEYLQSA